MNTLVSGTFEQADDARQALRALGNEGFGAGEIASFAFDADGPMSPPQVEASGVDPAIAGALSGAAVGGGVGVVVGLASLPLLGPVAAVAGLGAGAYVGSLVGTLSRLGDPDHPDRRDGDPDSTSGARGTGTVVAVQVREPGRRAAAIRVLREQGARGLEMLDGSIVDGCWTDFDPGQPLQLLPA